jgi:hypothetical protein
MLSLAGRVRITAEENSYVYETMLKSSADITKRAAAMLGTPADLLQDPLELKKQVDRKLICYLGMLPLRWSADLLHHGLYTAIRLK